MGLASGGYCHGQSPVGGPDWAQPHDRAKNGTLEAITIERPKLTLRHRQHLCLDKAYDNPTGHATVAATNYVPHIRPIGEEPPKNRQPKHPARRWVVERTLAWLSKCRAILVRYDKRPENYLGLVQIACALLWYRRLATQKHVE